MVSRILLLILLLTISASDMLKFVQMAFDTDIV